MKDAQGKIALLDLVDHGIEDYTQYNDKLINSKLHNILEKIFITIDDAPIRRIESKLLEIDKKSPYLANLLLLTMKNYRWAMTKIPLKKLANEYAVSTHLNLEDYELVPLAIRKYFQINIFESNWSVLHEYDRTALIFHEMIYSLIIPKEIEVDKYEQNASLVRQLVAEIFSPSFAKDELHQMFSKYLPIAEDDQVYTVGSNLITNSLQVTATIKYYNREKEGVVTGSSQFDLGLTTRQRTDSVFNKICKIPESKYSITITFSQAGMMELVLREFQSPTGNPLFATLQPLNQAHSKRLSEMTISYTRSPDNTHQECLEHLSNSYYSLLSPFQTLPVMHLQKKENLDKQQET